MFNRTFSFLLVKFYFRVEHAYNFWNSRVYGLGLYFIFLFFITIVYIITWMFICVSRILCVYYVNIQKNSAESSYRCFSRGRTSKALTLKSKAIMDAKKQNRKPPLFWQSKKGYQEFMTKCEQRGQELLLSEDRWENSKVTSNSKIPVKCINCNTGLVEVRLTNYVHRGMINCKCRFLTQHPNRNQFSGNMWKHESGFNIVVKKCKEHNLEVILNLEQWKKEIKRRDTKFRIKCRGCPVIATTTCYNFMKADSISCLCNNNLMENRYLRANKIKRL